MDGAVVDAVRANDLGRLASLPVDDVANAAMDGLPQALMLAGVLQRVSLAVDVLSYEAPTYYGMLVATYS
jgi:aromatic ring-opening dioxygenase LigB subunit